MSTGPVLAADGTLKPGGHVDGWHGSVGHLWSQWVGASLAAGLLLAGLGVLLSGAASGLLLTVGGSALAGAGQALVLRRYGAALRLRDPDRASADWLLASVGGLVGGLAVGWALAAGALALAVGVAGAGVLGRAAQYLLTVGVLGLAVGAGCGVGQWRILRRTRRPVAWWIGMAAVAGGLGALAAGGVGWTAAAAWTRPPAVANPAGAVGIDAARWGGPLGGAMAGASGSIAALGDDWPRLFVGQAGVSGAVAAAVTGAGLLWLGRRRRAAEEG
jgi:hypothetical protein